MIKKTIKYITCRTFSYLDVFLIGIGLSALNDGFYITAILIVLFGGALSGYINWKYNDAK